MNIKQTSAFMLKENWTKFTYTGPINRYSTAFESLNLKSTRKSTKLLPAQLKVMFVWSNGKTLQKKSDEIIYQTIDLAPKGVKCHAESHLHTRIRRYLNVCLYKDQLFPFVSFNKIYSLGTPVFTCT